MWDMMVERTRQEEQELGRQETGWGRRGDRHDGD